MGVWCDNTQEFLAAKLRTGRAGSNTDADAWLSLRRAEILKEEWTPASAAKTTFDEYAELWFANRHLEATTRQHYRPPPP